MGDLERVHDALFGGFSGGVRQLARSPLIPRSNIKDITNVARRHLPQKPGDPSQLCRCKNVWCALIGIPTFDASMGVVFIGVRDVT